MAGSPYNATGTGYPYPTRQAGASPMGARSYPYSQQYQSPASDPLLSFLNTPMSDITYMATQTGRPIINDALMARLMQPPPNMSPGMGAYPASSQAYPPSSYQGMR